MAEIFVGSKEERIDFFISSFLSIKSPASKSELRLWGRTYTAPILGLERWPNPVCIGQILQMMLEYYMKGSGVIVAELLFYKVLSFFLVTKV